MVWCGPLYLYWQKTLRKKNHSRFLIADLLTTLIYSH